MKALPDASLVEQFRGIITQRLGLVFDGSRVDELAELLRLRMQLADAGSPDAYLRRLRTSREELRAIAGYLTVSETHFFRIADHFRALAQVVLPERMRVQADRRQLSILSLGCASGEEAYSVAMVVCDCADLGAWQVSIRGVDVNPAMIAKAVHARYSQWSLRDTLAEFQTRHFRSNGQHFHLHDSIRQMVVFQEGNLVDAAAAFWHSSAYDVILARNVLMYFSPEAAKAVIGRIADSLAPGGYLFLGPAENLRGITQDFHLCHTNDTFYYQRRGRPRQAQPVEAGSYVPSPVLSPALGAAEISNGWVDSIRLASERVARLTSSQPSLAGARAVAPVAPVIAGQNGAHNDVQPALSLMRQERFTEALAALPTSAGGEFDPDVQLLRAVLLVNGGQLCDAEKVCQQLLAVDELNAGAQYVMALCREQAGDRAAAMDHDRTATYLDPSFAIPHLHLGLLSRRAGDLATARLELNQASLLLTREDPSRILLFGGGFGREALVEMCRRELQSCGGFQ